jgi:hypothetical protein
MLIIRSTKVRPTVTSTGSPAYQFFGYVNGKCVHQSRKLWRREADAIRAANAWARKGN